MGKGGWVTGSQADSEWCKPKRRAGPAQLKPISKKLASHASILAMTQRTTLTGSGNSHFPETAMFVTKAL